MAAIHRSIAVAAPADLCWQRVSRFDDPAGLAPGFVASCRMVDGERVVGFSDGGTVREVRVACDEGRRRLSYSAVGGQARHHHAVMEVVAIDDGSSRIDWTTDILPDALAPFVAARMDAGAEAIGRAFA